MRLSPRVEKLVWINSSPRTEAASRLTPPLAASRLGSLKLSVPDPLGVFRGSEVIFYGLNFARVASVFL